jgi:quercetin dioxygenase-like cupin family protein
MNRLALAAALCAGLALGAAGVVVAQSAASRTMLQAIDVSGTNREAHLGTASIPPGGRAAPHTHPGEELGLVTDGSLTLKVAGRPDRTLVEGDSFVIPRGTVHEVDAEGGATIVSAWIVAKGQPLASPAP